MALLAAGSLVGLALLSRANGWQLLGATHDWWLWLVVAVPVALLAAALLEAPRADRPAATNRRIAILLIALSLACSLAALGLLLATLVRRGDQRSPSAPRDGVRPCCSRTSPCSASPCGSSTGAGRPRERTPRSGRGPISSSRRTRTPRLARPGWSPHAVDYLYVSLTNSIAFSPTDTMPLTRRAKGLMGRRVRRLRGDLLLVAARAVNVFGRRGAIRAGAVGVCAERPQHVGERLERPSSSGEVANRSSLRSVLARSARSRPAG